MADLEAAAKEVSSLAERVAEAAKSLQRQRDFIEQVVAALQRDPPNISALQRLMKFHARNELIQLFPQAAEVLKALDEVTREAWREVSLALVAQFRNLATEAGFNVEGQPPKLAVGRGIEVAFQLNENKTIVNGVTIQTVDPHDVLKKVRAEHERLWTGAFDAERFMEELYNAYQAEISAGKASPEGVPILKIYERMRGSLSPSAKKAFGREVFAAKVSRALESGARGPGGRVLVLSPVAASSEALWIHLPDREERAYRGLVKFREGA